MNKKLLFAHLAILVANLIYAINYGFAKDVMNGGYVPLVGNRIVKEKEGSLNIFGLNPMVEKIISISQLDTVFNITDNEENALKNISWKNY